MKRDLHHCLADMSHRTNVMKRFCSEERLVLIYDDHRYLLNVLFKVFKSESLQEPPNLVFFDSHDDARRTEKASVLLSLIGVKTLSDASEKQFFSFVDYDIDTNDGNWLSVACELNLVGDVVVIGNKHGTNVVNDVLKYTSEDGHKHSIFQLNAHIDEEIGPRGKLGDVALDKEFKAIRSFFAYKPSQYYGQIGEMKPFILDYDLDYFTLWSEEEGSIPWPQKIWEKRFGRYTPGHTFVRDLMRKAEVITISREPDFCESIAGSNYNLQNLDNYFFDGQLGTNLNF